MADDTHFANATEEVDGMIVFRMPVEFSPYPRISCEVCLGDSVESWATYIGQQPGTRPFYPEGRYVFLCKTCGCGAALYRDDLENYQSEVFENAGWLTQFKAQNKGKNDLYITNTPASS